MEVIVKKKVTLNLGGPLARLVRKTAQDLGRSTSKQTVAMLEAGLASDALSYMYDLEGNRCGVHGLYNQTRTEADGRVCIYVSNDTLKQVYSIEHRFPELAGGTVSSRVRALIYAGMMR